MRDRSFRLAKNNDQNRVDFITGVSFAATWVILTALTKMPVISVGLSNIGVVDGILYHLLTKKVEVQEGE